MNHPNQNTHHRFRLSWIICFMAIALVSGSADRAVAEEESLDSDLQIRGARVLAAFHEVVKNVRHCTVEIWCEKKQAALGVVIDKQGHVLTKASELLGDSECRFADDTCLPAEVIALDRTYDLALLKVEPERELTPVAWATEDFQDVGRWVVTPGRDYHPVAVGVVSVGEIEVRPLRGRGMLGVTIDNSQERPTIQNVSPFSSAARSGLKTGDIILQLADSLTDTSETLKETLKKYRPGDAFFLRILRGSAYMNLHVTLDGNMHHAFERQGLQNRMGGKISLRRGGFPRALQHDTVLGPHECGGPLVNLKGEVVGLNIARAGRTETFALPVSVVRSRIAELLSGRMAVVMPTAVLPDGDETLKLTKPRPVVLPEPPPLPES